MVAPRAAFELRCRGSPIAALAEAVQTVRCSRIRRPVPPERHGSAGIAGLRSRLNRAPLCGRQMDRLSRTGPIDLKRFV